MPKLSALRYNLRVRGCSVLKLYYVIYEQPLNRDRSSSDRVANEEIFKIVPGWMDLLVLEVDRLLGGVVPAVDLEKLPSNAEHIAHLRLKDHQVFVHCPPRRHSKTLKGRRQVLVQLEGHPRLEVPCQGLLWSSPKVFFSVR